MLSPLGLYRLALCYERAFPKAWAGDALGNLPRLQRPPRAWALGDWQGYAGSGS